MTKIDKLLYGGFAAVAVGVVVAILVTVFSPPKQLVEKTVEMPPPPPTEQAPMETASPVDDLVPLDGYVGYHLDDNGNKVFLTAEDIAESDAIEAEFKREEAERIAKEQAEKEWWESRQDWVERFPFQPTPHPEITYDPVLAEECATNTVGAMPRRKRFRERIKKTWKRPFIGHWSWASIILRPLEVMELPRCSWVGCCRRWIGTRSSCRQKWRRLPRRRSFAEPLSNP